MTSSPLWKYVPASLAHQLAPLAIHYIAGRMPNDPPEWKSFTWKGLHFPNRLGIAGGVDKNAVNILDWPRLGAGFMEIGTVTPYSQNANKGKTMDRDWDQKNLWNKMGFPNHGSDEIYFNLLNERKKIHIPLFVNIGKNRSRPNEEAELDYIYLTDRFAPVADAFVVNISSPNTAGLRDLQSDAFLKKLITAVVKQAGGKPVLVKLSPDMSQENFENSLEICAVNGASGFVLTNTTLQRPDGCPFPKEGGLSGKDLALLSKKHLKQAISFLAGHREEFLLVSVGGVLNPDDVKERLDLGADLVQSYSALVFYGPQFFRDTAELMGARS